MTTNSNDDVKTHVVRLEREMRVDYVFRAKLMSCVIALVGKEKALGFYAEILDAAQECAAEAEADLGEAGC